MTKLQEIISQIQALPAEEREELVSILGVMTDPGESIFELTDEESEELDYRLKNDTVMFTHEETMKSMREKYAEDTSTK